MLYVIIAANVAVFLAMSVITGSTSWSAQTLYEWGGDYGAETLHGAWWRLVSSMFLHVGPEHILGNMLLLWIAGRFVESRIGPVSMLVVYMVSGVCASLVSAISHPEVVGVGASGAIAGIMGVLVVLYASGRFPDISGSWVAQTVGINVLYSFVPNVDWAAHAGGFVAGAVCGGLLLTRMRRAS